MRSQFFPQAGFLQYKIVFGDPAANLEKVKELLQGMEAEANAVVVLPELWAYGFDYANVQNLANQTPFLLKELTTLASKLNIVLAGSLMEGGEGSEVFNTLFFVGPEGVLGKYQKQHLFSFWKEDSFFAPGGFFEPISSPNAIIGGLICYDLRFPELARDQAFHGAQLLVVSAEWPKIRADHWQALLIARAIENQVFVVACNSCGNTGEYELGGNSMVIGPDGTILLQAGGDEETGVKSLDLHDLEKIRTNFCPAGERPRPIRDSAKPVELSQLLEKIKKIRQQQGRIAFTNGCFDILHSGHVAYLERARSTADCLVVGMNSDSSIRRIKGEGRPVNPEQDRARILSSLACVDYVVIFDEETPQNLITAIMPDVLVKGADWAEGDIVGAPEVKAAGGRVVRIPFEHDVSTTALISRIQSNE